MISPEYCQMQARYNAWQNGWIGTAVETMSDDELRQNRGAFFGSIFATLNHILWADQFWFFRLGLGPKPDIAPKDHVNATPNLAAWSAERATKDAKIMTWADGLSDDDLAGEIKWRSALKDKDMVNSRAQCIMHMFNHQTHHRGQVHAMLTGAGLKTQDTDLVFLDI